MKFKIFLKEDNSVTEVTSLTLNKSKSWQNEIWEIEIITKYIINNKSTKIHIEKEIYNSEEYKEETIHNFYNIKCNALKNYGYIEKETKENNFITVYKDSILL